MNIAEALSLSLHALEMLPRDFLASMIANWEGQFGNGKSFHEGLLTRWRIYKYNPLHCILQLAE